MLKIEKTNNIYISRSRVLTLSLFLMAGLAVNWYSSIANAAITNWQAPSINALVGGRDSNCAVAADKVYCWGGNTWGQIGNPSILTTESAKTPVAVDTSGILAGKSVHAIDSGPQGSYCALADNTVACWGRSYGNFGGASGNYTSPVGIDMNGVLAGKTLKNLDVGDGHTCMFDTDGAAYCIGLGGSGRLGNGTTSTSTVPVAVSTAGVLNGKTVTDIAASSGSSCAIASGAAYCWGEDGLGQLGNDTTLASSNVPVAVDTSGVLNGKTLVAIGGGLHTFCAVSSDGHVYCWGRNDLGQLGNDSTVDSAVPVEAIGALAGHTITSITVGTSSTCALDSSGGMYCWGNSPVGDGTYSTRRTPVAVVTVGTPIEGKTPLMITVGYTTHKCAATINEVFCWGFNPVYQLGNNTTTQSAYATQVKFDTSSQEGSYRVYKNSNSSTPGNPLSSTDIAGQLGATNQAFRVRTGVKSAAVFGPTDTSQHTCSVSNNKIYCWGLGTSGQLGNGTNTSSSTPVEVNTGGVMNGKTITAVATGIDFTCAVASETVYCWGANSLGQLGNSNNTASNVPVAVTTSGVLNNKSVTQINAGTGHICAIASGKAYCWGGGGSGRLGNSTWFNSNVPVAVTTTGVLNNKVITNIQAGDGHSCALTVDGVVACWGGNNAGQLGNNSTTDANAPVAVVASGVLSGKTVTALSIGFSRSCVIATGKAYCWGNGSGGGLGNGGISDSSVPVAVTTTGALSGKTLTQVAYGNGFGCVLDTNGLAYCWGNGTLGSLGNGWTGVTANPVAVSTTGVLYGKKLDSITTVHNAVCGTSSGNLYCWGQNTYGQLGNELTANSNVPVIAKTTRTIPSAPIEASVNTYKLQFAQKSATTCSLQTTGYADVTDTSTIAYHTNASVVNGSAITSNANDPVATSSSVPQTYQGAGTTTFTNSVTIPGDKTGLWDFALKDNGAPASTSYCLRLANVPSGTPVESILSYPEITTASGLISVDFVNNTGVVISNPTISLPSKTSNATPTTSTATYLGTASNNHLQVTNNLTENGWNMSLAATNGATALWDNGNGDMFDFNDISGASDGSDSDTLGGQLQLDFSSATTSATAPCTTTGITAGSTSSFAEGTANSITMMSATSGADTGCQWQLSDVSILQHIPSFPPVGTYTLPVTATVVAL